MSGIAGVWNLDGAPLDPALLARMVDRLAHRGPDGASQWVSEAVGLACQHLWTTPESINELQPLSDRRGVRLIFDGRLDNRETLHAMAGSVAPLPATASDAALALAVYRAAGDELPAQLLGDFALALFDPARQTLLLARDAVGVRPLYYCRTARTLLFASEVKALLAHPEVRAEPDDDALADFLINRQHDPSTTFFRGIASLPPAHVLIATRETLRVRRYWDFDPVGRIRLARAEEYVEAFREIFGRAVQRRLRCRTPVAVSVSGGVDSSAIFGMAHALLSRHAGLCPLLIGVSNLLPEGTPSDELAFLGALEQHLRTTVHRVPMPPRWMADRSDEQIRATEAPFLDELWGLTHGNLTAARQAGARVMLTGHWGDQIMFSQAYLVDLARQLRWMTIERHLREFGTWLTDVEPRWFYRRFALDLVKYHLPAALAPAARRAYHQRQDPWYALAFRRRAHRALRQRPALRLRHASLHARSVYEQVRAGYQIFCMEWNNKLAAAHGLEFAYPFLDRELISFVMQVPGAVHAHGGVPKALLRESIRSLVPEAIVERHWKADFTHLVNDTMREEYPRLLETLEAGGQAMARGYLVDAAGVRRTLTALAARLNHDDCAAAWALWDLVSLERWLHVFCSPDPCRN